MGRLGFCKFLCVPLRYQRLMKVKKSHRARIFAVVPAAAAAASAAKKSNIIDQ